MIFLPILVEKGRSTLLLSLKKPREDLIAEVEEVKSRKEYSDRIAEMNEVRKAENC